MHDSTPSTCLSKQRRHGSADVPACASTDESVTSGFLSLKYANSDASCGRVLLRVKFYRNRHCKSHLRGVKR